MAQQTTDTSIRPVIVRTDVVPTVAVRVTGALLALAIATVHVADQGGITALAPPSWIGWGYRVIEVGALLTVLLLLVPDSAADPGLDGLGGRAALGAGPLIGYLASRTVGPAR